jgi:hypothetical protein
MTTQTTTTDTILARYADDIAFVAEEKPATTLADFVNQMEIAADHLAGAGIQGASDLDAAAAALGAANSNLTDDGKRTWLINSAAAFLANTTDMVDEYRLML